MVKPIGQEIVATEEMVSHSSQVRGHAAASGATWEAPGQGRYPETQPHRPHIFLVAVEKKKFSRIET